VKLDSRRKSAHLQEQPEAIGDGDNDENIEHFVKILYSANQEGTYAPVCMAVARWSQHEVVVQLSL
jgi:hypothetical protein